MCSLAQVCFALAGGHEGVAVRSADGTGAVEEFERECKIGKVLLKYCKQIFINARVELLLGVGILIIGTD